MLMHIVCNICGVII